VPQDPTQPPGSGLSGGADLALSLLELGDAIASSGGESQQPAIDTFVGLQVMSLSSTPSAVIEAEALLARLWDQHPTEGRMAAVLVLDQIKQALNAEQPLDARLSDELDRRLDEWLE
jgi:hypothetical protein